MKRNGHSKRRPWIDFALVGAIIALSLSILLFISMDENIEFQQTTASATETPEISTSITDSLFPDIRLVNEKKSGTALTYTIHYPKTAFDHVNEEITQYITTSKEKYMNDLQKSRVAKGDLHIDVELSQFKNELYSVTFKTNIMIDDSKHNSSIQTYLFHKVTGEMISIENLLNSNILYLKVLAKHVKSQLLENDIDTNYLKTEQLLIKTTPQWINFNRFSLTDDTVTFYFNKGEIADPLAGIPTVTIPISFLNPILAQNYQNEVPSETTILTAYDKNIKRVALTFDDGPHPVVTPQVLNLLDWYHAEATFFMLGQRVKSSPEIAKDVWMRGHEIGNHTWGHPRLTAIKAERVLEEYHSTNNMVYSVTGQYPTVFRPPYGAINDPVTSLLNLPVVMWSIDTLDWKHRNAHKLLWQVQYHMHNNAIILMHDIHQTTADGLVLLLAYLHEEGYQFVTVSDLLLVEQLNP